MQNEKKLQESLRFIQPTDRAWEEKARNRTAQLLMPPRALGRLHDISERLCGIQRTLSPDTEKKAVLVMAGDHGVVEEGVSAFPQAVTGEMIRSFCNDWAGINVLARQAKAEVWVADLGVIPDIDAAGFKHKDRFLVRKIARGTANLAQGPALPREEAAASVLAGMELAEMLFDQGVALLGTGDMGIGNTTPSAAIGAVLTGADPALMVGRGSGVDDQGLKRKVDAVRKGLAVNAPNPLDGLDVLAKVGGLEIGGIAGIVLAGAKRGRVVVIDGFISTAGALIACALCPAARDSLFAGHVSEEPGHRIMLEHLGLTPILNLGMRLGEGTGAVLAMNVIEGAARVFREMATFAEAGVSGG